MKPFEGPGLSPPFKGPNKIKTDDGKLALFREDGRLIWFPAGSWFMAGYAGSPSYPPPSPPTS